MNSKIEIEKKTPNRVYFYHAKTNPRVTIAGTYIDGHLYLGAARCSKKDCFEKKMGRYISTGRMVKAIREEINCVPRTIITEANGHETPGSYFVAVARGTAEKIAQLKDVNNFVINIDFESGNSSFTS